MVAARSHRESDIQVTLGAAKQTGSDAAIWAAMRTELGITTVKLERKPAEKPAPRTGQPARRRLC